MRTLPLCLAVALAGTIVPVAAAQDTTASQPKQDQPKEQKKKSKNPDVITREEFETLTGVQTAYDAIKRLRPNFFNIRSSQTKQAGPAEATNFKVTNAPPMQLYVNGARVAGVDYLRTVPMTALWEARKLNGTDASFRFGADHESGAILVTTGTPPVKKP